MQRVTLQPRTELLELELLTPAFTPDRVVVIARLLANEENAFDFFLSFSAFGHDSCTPGERLASRGISLGASRFDNS